MVKYSAPLNQFIRIACQNPWSSLKTKVTRVTLTFKLLTTKLTVLCPCQLSHRPLVSIDIKICSFIFKISCWQVRWDERTDGRTNGQRENIMTPSISLSWWRNI